MYNVTPGVKDAWTALFEWAGKQAAVNLEIIDHAPPAGLNELWARTDLGCVFMCGWPFAMTQSSDAKAHPKIICAPIPAPPRYHDKPVYFTDFIVSSKQTYSCLEDTFGGRLAWTVNHSHSGFNAPRHHLMKYRTEDRANLYSETLGPLITPRAIIEAIASGRADVGPVDGYYLDILRRNEPDTLSRVKVIETSDPSPMPPLVAHADIADEDLGNLQKAFQKAKYAPELQGVFNTLMVKDFAVSDAQDYQRTIDWADAATQANYPSPG